MPAVATIAVAAALAAQQPAPSDRARAEAASQRAAERIRVLERESEALAAQETTLLGQLRKFEIERELRGEEAAKADRELTATRRTLEETTARIDALQHTANNERPDVEARLTRLYKLGNAGYWRLLLDVDDLRSMGRAYRTAAALTRLDRERVQQHQRTLESLARERRMLEARLKEVTRLQEQSSRARAAADRAVKARTALVDAIDARRDLNAQLTGELELAQRRLQGTLTQLAAGRPAVVSLPLRPFRGALPWPLQGIVVGAFGSQPPGTGGGLRRNGIEISVAEGQPVRAVHDGVVATADPFPGYGTLIILEHGDGALSLYGHLRTLEVSKGDRVDAGALLATSGRNPAGNPALYFELRVDGKPVDPLQWLQK